MFYKGSKDMNQTDPSGNAFTYRPSIYRVGAFGNYLFFDKLDLLGGYIHSDDDWEISQSAPAGKYLANSYRGEADYYLKTGTVIMARLDRSTANVTGQPNMHTRMGNRRRTCAHGARQHRSARRVYAGARR